MECAMKLATTTQGWQSCGESMSNGVNHTSENYSLPRSQGPQAISHGHLQIAAPVPGSEFSGKSIFEQQYSRKLAWAEQKLQGEDEFGQHIQYQEKLQWTFQPWDAGLLSWNIVLLASFPNLWQLFLLLLWRFHIPCLDPKLALPQLTLRSSTIPYTFCVFLLLCFVFKPSPHFAAYTFAVFFCFPWHTFFFLLLK